MSKIVWLRPGRIRYVYHSEIVKCEILYPSVVSCVLCGECIGCITKDQSFERFYYQFLLSMIYVFWKISFRCLKILPL